MPRAFRHVMRACVVAASLAVLPTPALAQPMGMPGGMGAGPRQGPPHGRGQVPPPGMGTGGGWQAFVMQLELTDQQKKDIRASVSEQREAEQARREEMRSLQQQLAKAIYTSAPDTNEIGELVGRLADAQRLALAADVVLQQRVSALLTDEQREELVTLLAKGPARGGPPPGFDER